MREKRWVSAVILFLVHVVLIVCAVLILYAISTVTNPGDQEEPTMEGYYVRSGDTSFIVSGGELTIMKNCTGDSEAFSKLENGDFIRIAADEVQDAIYPGETGVYSCKRLRKGTIDDIPAAVIRELEDYGYGIDDE